MSSASISPTLSMAGPSLGLTTTSASSSKEAVYPTLSNSGDTPDNTDNRTAEAADIPYTGVRRLFDQIERATKDDLQIDCLSFRNVSPQDYADVEKTRDSRHGGLRLFYLAQHQRLIVTVPTGPHEKLHACLGTWTNNEFVHMGLERQWESIGSRTYPPRQLGGSGGQGGGEGDSCWGPTSQHGPDRWPTLVIEAGVSQSLASLRMKMNWWFDKSGHQVKIIVLAKLDRNQRLVTVEKWTERPHIRPGATATRRTPPVSLQPEKDQWVKIKQAAGISNTDPARLNPASYRAARNLPLQLEFNLLFGRPAAAGERDITFGVGDMQDYAVRVWEAL